MTRSTWARDTESVVRTVTWLVRISRQAQHLADVVGGGELYRCHILHLQRELFVFKLTRAIRFGKYVSASVSRTSVRYTETYLQDDGQVCNPDSIPNCC